MVAAAVMAALACPAQPALVERRGGPVVRTAVVACDGRRRVVVRRARLRRTADEPGIGRVITDVAGAGAWVAWTEIRYRSDRERVTVHRRRIAGGRMRERRTYGLARRGPRWPRVAVVVTTRGEVGWLAGGAVFASRDVEGRVRIVQGIDASRLRLEDDRTLRWWDHERETWEFHDLRPWPGGGCPVRSRFRVVAESPEVVASEGDYTFMGDPVGIVRACARSTGADPVIARSFVYFASGEQLGVAGVSGAWVVLVRRFERAAGCAGAKIEVVEAVADRYGRGGSPACADAPARGAPLTVTANGVPAWIVQDGAGSRLLATVRGEGPSVVQLDAAGSGGLTGLAASGTRVSWRHDGEPRAVDLG
jgi:hypothetical protein